MIALSWMVNEFDDLGESARQICSEARALTNRLLATDGNREENFSRSLPLIRQKATVFLRVSSTTSALLQHMC